MLMCVTNLGLRCLHHKCFREEKEKGLIKDVLVVLLGNKKKKNKCSMKDYYFYYLRLRILFEILD